MWRHQTGGFRARIPLCEMAVWDDSMGGGTAKSGAANMPHVHPLPSFVCALLILLASVACYAAVYGILAAVNGLFGLLHS